MLTAVLSFCPVTRWLGQHILWTKIPKVVCLGLKILFTLLHFMYLIWSLYWLIFTKMWFPRQLPLHLENADSIFSDPENSEVHAILDYLCLHLVTMATPCAALKIRIIWIRRRRKTVLFMQEKISRYRVQNLNVDLLLPNFGCRDNNSFTYHAALRVVNNPQSTVTHVT